MPTPQGPRAEPAAPPMDLLQQVSAFLALSRTACLATVDEQGHPHAANVQYAADDALRLTFVSSAGSAHAQHLAARADAAVTVYAHDDRPEQIHGLQAHGRCVAVPDDTRDAALAGYHAKYPFVLDPPYRDALARQTAFVFTPTWVRWIDNRQGFGHRREWCPAPAEAPTPPTG